MEKGLQTSSELREQYQISTPIRSCQDQDSYLKYLQSRGFKLNSKIFLATFQLSNGLTYNGLATRQEIMPGQTLIKVPEPLVLNTYKALQQPSLQVIYQDKFYSRQNSNWQGRIFTTYCIFLLIQKDQNNPWFYMVQRFPKSCDMAAMWDQQLVNSIKNPIIKANVARMQVQFDLEWSEFQLCRQKYNYLQHQQFNHDRYKAVYSTTNNRAFSKYTKYLSMVPFVEFINHHSSKVYYTVQRQQSNGFNYQDDQYNDESSSNGSYDSCQSDHDDPVKQKMQTGQNQTLFLTQQLLKHKQSMRQYFANQKHYPYYSSNLLKNKDIEVSPSGRQYEYFVIKCSKLDSFPANNQVYFRYGRDTSNNLLTYYGFAIQGNKYEYVSIIPKKTSYTQELAQMMSEIAERKISLFKKNKIYRHLLNIDLIVYQRFLNITSQGKHKENFDIFRIGCIIDEISVLEAVEDMLRQNLKQFQIPINLANKSLTYQQYFIQVYLSQKFIILRTQITMLQRLKVLLRAIQSGKTKTEACQTLTNSQAKIFARYLAMIP